MDVPSLWRIERCVKHSDYQPDCLLCQEEVLTTKTEAAYRAGLAASRQASAPGGSDGTVVAGACSRRV
jgi:hypothetical protein